jgi:hypothetical protein
MHAVLRSKKSRWRLLNYWPSANIEPIDGTETRRPVHRAIITINCTEE